MQLLLFALVAGFVPFVHGYASNKTYPSIEACDNEVETNIKRHWEKEGKPENVLKRIQESGKFIVTQTSYDYYNSENKCIFMTYADSVMNATFIPKNGSPVNLIYNLEEKEDGTIKGRLAGHDAPEYRWNWYPIYFDHGVVVCYVCGDVKGSKHAPVTSVLVAENKKESLSRSEVKDVRGLIKSWGLSFKYNYGSECDSKE